MSAHDNTHRLTLQCLCPGATRNITFSATHFSMLASTWGAQRCVPYRDDMNLLCWTPPASPQARHGNRGLFNSNTPLLLLSTTLSILCVCFLLYLLTEFNRPRRNAQAAIFPALARVHTRVYERTRMLRSRNDFRAVHTIIKWLQKDKNVLFSYFFLLKKLVILRNDVSK